ncbi:MAG TPA: DUF4157 domain-containing protein, partial [Candidatus Dormibacteraeota bacterium]|nr:DUF4157 domain-containing protein [Candidatus Dormibacteraeota bacterium]
MRIHRDGRAARSAQAVNAKAYTLGNHVVFGPGQYAPNSQAGRTVIAHELMHVLQRSGRSSLGVMPPTARGEAQAEAGGQGQAAAPVTSAASSAGGVGRMAEKDLTSLDDGQLQNEYQMTQQWINDHPEGDDHAAGISYMREIEAEVTRRSSSTGPDGGVDASAGGQGPRTDQTQTAQRADGGDQGQCPIPMVCDPGFTPGTTTAAAVSSGDSQSSSLPPLSQQVTRMTAAHAGGAMGERDMAFALGQQGHEFYAGPGGPGGHGLTEHGFDGVSYNPTNGETWLIDNKASGRLSTVRSATAISSNLEAGLVDAIATISAQPASPNQPQVLQNLQTALAAVRAGQPLPSNVKLKVTNAGGYSTGVSKGLQSQGVQFEDLTGPNIQAARAQDIATAKAQGV